MGFKLRTQIAGLLFLLFSLTVAITGYFNVSILFDVIKSLAEEQSNTSALAVTSWIERVLPLEGYTSNFLSMRMAQRSDVVDYLGHVRGLRSFQVLTPDGVVLWAYGQPVPFPLHRDALRQAVQQAEPFRELWVLTPSADVESTPVGGQLGLLLSKEITYVYYRAIPDPTGTRIVGVMRLSLVVDELPRRLRIVVLGNVLLGVVFLVTAFIAISIWTKNAINRPLEMILQGQERIGRGDFSAHVSVEMPSTNEIVSMSTSFNRMSADLRRFQKELEVKTTRMDALNQEYRRLNEQLESQVDDKTRELKEFFSVVTHDMKVPLAAIQGYADLLMRSRRNPLDEKQLRFVQGISTACSHLLGMTRNMLESVKYDAGRITYFMEDFDLADVVREVAEQIRQQADEKSIRFRFEVPPLCRRVVGDRTKIVRVLTNLLNNAVKFTPEGGAIEIRARDRASMAEIEVTDSGVGIAEDQIPHLFEKFTQFHTEEGAASSIGLGLYIVHKILEGHGQGIQVVSSPGRGTTFTFSLPKAVATARVESLETLEGGDTETTVAVGGTGPEEGAGSP
ncbi:MAG: HAMP domain-containing protein [Proteobacteria bacterium]|nr:HAMP domain-containing protein [Pseudomonadota bacterium]